MSIDEKTLIRVVHEAVAAQLSTKKARKFIPINKTLTSADTEYKITLPAGCKQFSVKVRTDDVDLKIGATKGSVDTATPRGDYFTLNAGRSWDEPNLELDNEFTFYVACATAAKVVEVVAWY